MKHTITTLFICIVVSVHGQSWRIESISAGWKVFERQLVGTNPYAITPQLKEPLSYLANLNSIPNNSLYGDPFVVGFDNYYATMELKNLRPTRFWQRHRIPVGIVWTGYDQYPTGAISNIDYDTMPYTRYENAYKLYRRIQFLGIHSGMIRKFRLRENLFFVSGLQGQVSVAIRHQYRQVYDTTNFTPGIGFWGNTREDKQLAGKNYIQWQLYIPLALEYHAFHQRIGIRAEVGYGIFKNPYIDFTLADMESANAGVSVSYRFRE